MLKSRMERFGIKRRDLVIGAAVGITLAVTIVVFRLGALGVSADQPITIPVIAANAPAPLAPLTAQSSPQEIIALMLNSHTKWHNLQATALISSLDLRANVYATRFAEIQIQQFGQVRAQSGPVGQPPTFVWVSNGNTMWEEDRTRGTFMENPIPENARSLETYGPPVPPPDDKPYVVPHPLATLIHSPLAEYIYPQGLAQAVRLEEIQVVGAEIIAGRNGVAILRQVINEKGILLKKHKYWIDAQTGVMLKAEIYAQMPGWDKWSSQMTMTKIDYDRAILPETFTFQPAPGVKRVTEPRVP